MPSLTLLLPFLTSGSDLGVWPDCWVSVEFPHDPILRKWMDTTTPIKKPKVIPFQNRLQLSFNVNPRQRTTGMNMSVENNPSLFCLDIIIGLFSLNRKAKK